MFYNSFFLSGSSGGPHGSRWLIFDWRQMRDSFLFCFWNNNHNRSARRRNPCPPPLVKTRRQGHTQKKIPRNETLNAGQTRGYPPGGQGSRCSSIILSESKDKKNWNKKNFKNLNYLDWGGGSLSNKTMTSHAVNYLIVIELRFFVDFSMGGGVNFGWVKPLGAFDPMWNIVKWNAPGWRCNWSENHPSGVGGGWKGFLKGAGRRLNRNRLIFTPWLKY